MRLDRRAFPNRFSPTQPQPPLIILVSTNGFVLAAMSRSVSCRLPDTLSHPTTENTPFPNLASFALHAVIYAMAVHPSSSCLVTITILLSLPDMAYLLYKHLRNKKRARAANAIPAMDTDMNMDDRSSAQFDPHHQEQKTNQRSKSDQWLLLLGLVLPNFLAAVDVTIVSPAIPLISSHFGNSHPCLAPHPTRPLTSPRQTSSQVASIGSWRHTH
jgi:hypothetical protein